jgi:hypothetical protein
LELALSAPGALLQDSRELIAARKQETEKWDYGADCGERAEYKGCQRNMAVARSHPQTKPTNQGRAEAEQKRRQPK